MEKKRYIKPDATIIELKGEIMMTSISQIGGDSADGGITGTPGIGGSGDGDDAE